MVFFFLLLFTVLFKVPSRLSLIILEKCVFIPCRATSFVAENTGRKFFLLLLPGQNLHCPHKNIVCKGGK
jgi:hypothetical protein